MNKVKVALTFISIIIVAVPLTGIIYLHRHNLFGLVVPPEVNGLIDGSFAQTQFEYPMPVGEPNYDPETKTVKFSFSFTNPLRNDISIREMSGVIKCKEHGIILGDVSLEEPIQIPSGGTSIIHAFGTWTEQAFDHFETYHSGSEDRYINVSFDNLTVDIAGIKVQVDSQDIGWIELPK
jgi:hypothetical protein